MTEPRDHSLRVESDGLAIEVEIAAQAATLDDGLAAWIAQAIGAAAGQVQTAGEVALVLDDDARLRTLNRQWRGIDKPTNVLSFPGPAAQAGATRHLGDIAIAHETAAREAEAEGKPLRHHLAHLAVHGFLHLLGHDHETDAQAQVMEELERTILARIGVPDPYIARNAAD